MWKVIDYTMKCVLRPGTALIELFPRPDLGYSRWCKWISGAPGAPLLRDRISPDNGDINRSNRTHVIDWIECVRSKSIRFRIRMLTERINGVCDKSISEIGGYMVSTACGRSILLRTLIWQAPSEAGCYAVTIDACKTWFGRAVLYSSVIFADDIRA